MSKHTEDKFHTEVYQFLQLAMCPLRNDVFYFSIENRGNGKWEGFRRKKRGCVAGIPDIEILYHGRAYFIELKTPKGTLSPAQIHVHKKLRSCGCPVWVCRSLDEILDVLKQISMPLDVKSVA